MKTIKENITNEIIIKNSRFITIIQKINNSTINDIIEEIKVKFPKATHYCYAYIFNDYKKSSDDNEPTGTAGQPMLNVLEHEELNNVLAVTVRYFGGIKLGAGGLIRAYTKSITEALKNVQFIEMEKGYQITITFPYQEEKQLQYILKEDNIIKKEYDEKITYQVEIAEKTLLKLHNYTYTIEKEIYIEKSSN